jgi:hypothetical protein
MMVGGTPSTHWDYKFVDLKSEDRDAFEKEIKQAGTQGWEFCGSERLRKANEPSQLVLVFKKRHASEFPMGGGMGGGFGMVGPGGMGPMGGGPGGPGGGIGGWVGRPGGVPQAGPMPGGKDPASPAGTSPGPGVGLPGLSGGGAIFGRGGHEQANLKVTVLKLKYAKAEQLGKVLMQVFPSADITPEQRTNQLIVRATPEMSMEISKLMIELDVEVQAK